MGTYLDVAVSRTFLHDHAQDHYILDLLLMAGSLNGLMDLGGLVRGFAHTIRPQLGTHHVGSMVSIAVWAVRLHDSLVEMVEEIVVRANMRIKHLLKGRCRSAAV